MSCGQRHGGETQVRGKELPRALPIARRHRYDERGESTMLDKGAKGERQDRHALNAAVLLLHGAAHAQRSFLLR